jgi:hypothetical protein
MYMYFSDANGGKCINYIAVWQEFIIKSYFVLEVHTYIFTSPTICWHVYVDITYYNTCVVYAYVIYCSSVSAMSVRTAKVQIIYTY